MPTYLVTQHFSGFETYRVEAENEEEAEGMLDEGEIEEEPIKEEHFPSGSDVVLEGQDNGNES